MSETIDTLRAQIAAEKARAEKAEAERDALGIQLAAQGERLRLAMACAGHLRTAIGDGVIIDARAVDALAALDAVPGDALATSTKKDDEATP